MKRMPTQREERGETERIFAMMDAKSGFWVILPTGLIKSSIGAFKNKNSNIYINLKIYKYVPPREEGDDI